MGTVHGSRRVGPAARMAQAQQDLQGTILQACDQPGAWVNWGGFCRGSDSWENEALNTRSSKFSPEVRERAVRLAQEHRDECPLQWAAAQSIAPKIGRFNA